MRPIGLLLRKHPRLPVLGRAGAPADLERKTPELSRWFWARPAPGAGCSRDTGRCELVPGGDLQKMKQCRTDI
jgi:hypothetical protein